MALKKIAQKSICSCFRPKNSSHEKKSKVAKEVSLQRLLLSDVSDPNSPFFIHDLSNSLLGSNLHVFTLAELKLITSNFSKYNFLDEGGFGPVYKGFIDDKLSPGSKPQPVAVKVLNLNGSQGHKEWLAEVIILGQLRHPHLVKLIGYCCEDEHRLIVYEYMERGNLDKQLFRGYSASIPWSTRIKIALGAAKGLAFLHEEETPVIYRDFKASNILLDSDYKAKLSDFGLATDGPDGGDTHISTEVMGTHGYAAPEYIKTGHLTTMSDVFSFGVVLLELLTGRRSVDKNRRSRQQNLVEYARPLLKDFNKLDRIMDPRLEGQYSIEGAKKAALVAYQCLSNTPKNRPTMRSVVKTLESLMDLKDIPSGPFVYIVPREGKIHSCGEVKGHQDEIPVEKVGCDVQDRGKKDEELQKKRKDHPRRRRGHRNRHGVKAWRSRAVYSDTDLYRKLGSSLYNGKHRDKDDKMELA